MAATHPAVGPLYGKSSCDGIAREMGCGRAGSVRRERFSVHPERVLRALYFPSDPLWATRAVTVIFSFAGFVRRESKFDGAALARAYRWHASRRRLSMPRLRREHAQTVVAVEAMWSIQRPLRRRLRCAVQSSHRNHAAFPVRSGRFFGLVVLTFAGTTSKTGNDAMRNFRSRRIGWKASGFSASRNAGAFRSKAAADVSSPRQKGELIEY